MNEKYSFKASGVLTYKELGFSLVRMYPTSVLLTKDKLTYRWLGLPIGTINTKDITNVKIMNNKWVHYGLSNIFFAVMGALQITYNKGNKVKHTYIILSDKNLKILSKLIKQKIN